jgi:hypothetical protein
MKAIFKALTVVLTISFVSADMASESSVLPHRTVALCITGAEIPASCSGKFIEKAFTDRMGAIATHVEFSSQLTEAQKKTEDSRIQKFLNEHAQDNLFVYVNGNAEQTPAGDDLSLLDVFEQPKMLSSLLADFIDRLRNSKTRSCTLALDLSTSLPISDQEALVTGLVERIQSGDEPLPLLLIINTRPATEPQKADAPAWLASAIAKAAGGEALLGRDSRDGSPVPLSFTDLQLYLEEESVAEKHRAPSHRSLAILNLLQTAQVDRDTMSDNIVGEIRIRTPEEVIEDHARKCAEQLDMRGIRHLFLPEFSRNSITQPFVSSPGDLQGNSHDRYLRERFITEFNRHSSFSTFIDLPTIRIIFRKHNFSGDPGKLSRDSQDRLLRDLRDAANIDPDTPIAVLLCRVPPSFPAGPEEPVRPSPLISRIQMQVFMEDEEKQRSMVQKAGDGWMTPAQFSQRTEVNYVPPHSPDVEDVPAVPREAPDLIDEEIRKRESAVVEAMLAQQQQPHPLASGTALFRISIWLYDGENRDAAKECPVMYSDDGTRASVQLKSGDTYRIRVENNTERLAFLRLLVDGQNTLPEPVLDSNGQPMKNTDGSEITQQHQRVSPDRARYWAIKPGVSWVNGFYKTVDVTEKFSSNYNRFQVVSAADSLAGQSGNVDDTGVISAYFYHAVEDVQEQRMNTSANGRLGTALGEQVTTRLSVYQGPLVPAERPAVFMHVRYGNPAADDQH